MNGDKAPTPPSHRDASLGGGRPGAQGTKRTVSGAGLDAETKSTQPELKTHRLATEIEGALYANTLASGCPPLTGEQVAIVAAFVCAPTSAPVVARALRFAEAALAEVCDGSPSLGDVADETLIAIAERCDSRTLCALNATCRRFHAVVSSPAADKAWELACTSDSRACVARLLDDQHAAKYLRTRLDDKHYIMDVNRFGNTLVARESRVIDRVRRFEHYVTGRDGAIAKAYTKHFDTSAKMITDYTKILGYRCDFLLETGRFGDTEEILTAAAMLVVFHLRYGLYMAASHRIDSLKSMETLRDALLGHIVLDPRIRASPAFRWKLCCRILDCAAIWNTPWDGPAPTYGSMIAAHIAQATDVAHPLEDAVGAAYAARTPKPWPCYAADTLTASQPLDPGVSHLFDRTIRAGVDVAIAIKNGWGPLNTVLEVTGLTQPHGHLVEDGAGRRVPGVMCNDAAYLHAIGVLATESVAVKSARAGALAHAIPRALSNVPMGTADVTAESEAEEMRQGGPFTTRPAVPTRDMDHVPTRYMALTYTATSPPMMALDTTSAIEYRRYVEVFGDSHAEFRARMLFGEHANLSDSSLADLVMRACKDEQPFADLISYVCLLTAHTQPASREDAQMRLIFNTVLAVLPGGRIPIQIGELIDSRLRMRDTVHGITRSGIVQTFKITPECLLAQYGVAAGWRVQTPLGGATVAGTRGTTLWFFTDGDHGMSHWPGANDTRGLAACDIVPIMSATRDGGMRVSTIESGCDKPLAHAATLLEQYFGGAGGALLWAERDFAHPLFLMLTGQKLRHASAAGAVFSPDLFENDDSGALPFTPLKWLIQWTQLDPDERARAWIPAVLWIIARASVVTGTTSDIAMRLATADAPHDVRLAFAHWSAEILPWPRDANRCPSHDPRESDVAGWADAVVDTYSALMALLAPLPIADVAAFRAAHGAIAHMQRGYTLLPDSVIAEADAVLNGATDGVVDFPVVVDTLITNAHAFVASLHKMRACGGAPDARFIQDVVCVLQAVAWLPTIEEVAKANHGNHVEWRAMPCTREWDRARDPMRLQGYEHDNSFAEKDGAKEDGTEMKMNAYLNTCVSDLPSYTSTRLSVLGDLLLDTIFAHPALATDVLHAAVAGLRRAQFAGTGCTPTDIVKFVTSILNRMEMCGHCGGGTEWSARPTDIYNTSTRRAWRMLLDEFERMLTTMPTMVHKKANYDFTSTTLYRCMACTGQLAEDMGRFLGDRAETELTSSYYQMWASLDKFVAPLGVSLEKLLHIKDYQEYSIRVHGAPLTVRVVGVMMDKHVVLTKTHSTPHQMLVEAVSDTVEHLHAVMEKIDAPVLFLKEAEER